MSIELSVVVPCYNEEENISLIADAVSEAFFDVDYEIVFIDDGSTDGTWRAVSEKAAIARGSIRAVRFSRNFGKEAAIYAGLEKARGKYTALIDADLQQNPFTARKMLEMIRENSDCDMVVAYQEDRGDSKLMKFAKHSFYKIIDNLSEVNFTKNASDFRLFRENVKNAVLSMTEYHRFSKGLFSWVGFNTKFIPYKAEERKCGKTKWSFMGLVKYALDGIVSFSVKPLQWSITCGFLCGLFALLYLAFVVVQKLIWGIAVPGYATIVVLLLVLGGGQMVFMGILGEYLAKIFIQSKGRPIYVEKEFIDEIRD